LFRLLATDFLGPLLQTGFVLLKRDPDNQITAYNLTAELGLACACVALFPRRRNRRCQDCGANRSSCGVFQTDEELLSHWSAFTEWDCRTFVFYSNFVFLVPVDDCSFFSLLQCLDGPNRVFSGISPTPDE